MPAPSARRFDTGDFPELHALQTLAQRANGLLKTEVVCEVMVGDKRLPVHCLELGSTSASVPAVGFFGGVHGVERIGAQVIIAFLHSLIERLHWDDCLMHMLDNLRQPTAAVHGRQHRPHPAVRVG